MDEILLVVYSITAICVWYSIWKADEKEETFHPLRMIVAFCWLPLGVILIYLATFLFFIESDADSDSDVG